MTKAQLDSSLVGPENDEYDRIKATSDLVSELLQQAAEDRGYRLRWSWGDSNDWRVIIGIPVEEELTALLESEAAIAGFAHELIDLIGNVVALNTGFKLYLELDSDERVNANEGWFFRVKADGQFGHELVFIWNGERLSRA